MSSLPGSLTSYTHGVWLRQYCGIRQSPTGHATEFSAVGTATKLNENVQFYSQGLQVDKGGKAYLTSQLTWGQKEHV